MSIKKLKSAGGMKHSIKHLFIMILTLLVLNFSTLGTTPAHAAMLTVTNTNDNGAGSLRVAIASAGVGDTITFEPALSGQTIYLASTLALNQNVTIDGSRLASQITLSGDTDNNGMGNVPVLFVDGDVTAILNGLMITKGATSSDGGAIYNDGTLIITNSTLSGSSVGGPGFDGYGGGIYNNGILKVANSTFANNYASYVGGAIANFGITTITNSTISNNSAINGGGIFNSGRLNYANTIIANSTAGNDCYNDSGGMIGTNTNNLVEDGSCSASVSGDPNLSALADHGGLTQTFALLDGSIAIDAGDDAICAADPVNNESQNGLARPSGVHCDIGSYEKDTTAPTVTSAVRASADPTNASSVDFTVAFSEPVDDVDPGDFTLDATGTITAATIQNVIGSGSIRTVTVDTGSGSGTLRLDVPIEATITDLAGNTLSGLPYIGDQAYTVDKTAPTVLSINQASSDPTSASNVNFIVNFSEPVYSVDVSDFTLNVTGNITGAMLGDVTGFGSTRTVMVSTGSGSGTLRLDVPVDATITDMTDNLLSGLPYTGGQAYNLDKTTPTVISINRASLNPASALSVDYTVTFSEPVEGVDRSDFTLNATGAINGATIGSITGSGMTRTVTVDTGSGNGTLRLDVPDTASITDLVGNPLGGLPFTVTEAYSVLKTATFGDVASNYWSWSWIERLFNAGITGGCGAGKYCPDNEVTRAQMAVFLERGMHGSSYTPPATGLTTGYSDVPTNYWSAAWIKQLAADGITGGCGGGNYCPDDPVTRAQMAVFLLKAKYGPSYIPPAVGSGTGFSDVPMNYWSAAWIKQLAAEGITGGCGTGIYCPESPVTRAQMAVFLVRTFNLP